MIDIEIEMCMIIRRDPRRCETTRGSSACIDGTKKLLISELLLCLRLYLELTSSDAHTGIELFLRR